MHSLGRQSGRWMLLLVVVVATCVAGWSTFAHRAAIHRHPYAVEGPVTEPRLFGEGVISTRDDEFGATFTPDGKTCIFSVSIPRHYLYVILVSQFTRGKWSTPEVAPFSGAYRDSDPVLSPD